ncbi:hypothetical protein BH23BAC1_BH23BAC1_05230 [soil metagenome]
MKYSLIFTVIAFLLLGACNQNSSENINESTTRSVMDHHWETFENNDLDGVMEDYTEESILITPEATFRGLEEIRQNFVNAFALFPVDQSNLTLIKNVVEKDIAYILWEADTPEFKLSFATDSFVIRDGKIIRQTYAGVALPK